MDTPAARLRVDTEVIDLPYVIRPKGLRGTMAAMLAGAALLLVGVPAAQASPCKNGPTTKAFAAFGDNADYSLVPGGSFESGATGWSLTGAAVVSGNEPWKVGGTTNAKSLAINSTGRAVSGSVCVGAEHPTFRFFARRTSGTWGVLDVRLRWTDAGVTHETLVGSVSGGDLAWHPSRSFNLAQVIGISNNSQAVQTQFVFQPEGGSGAWAIDDVYVDPYTRG
jgi:hypothetical protein